MAIIYAAPRPFWTTEKVIGYACESDFGTPPPSIMPTVCLATVFVSILLDNRGKVDQAPGLLKCKRICAGITTTFAFGLSGMLIFATLIAGVCSVDQLIFGITLSLWLGLFLHFNVKMAATSHIKDLNKGQTEHPMNLPRLYLVSTLIMVFLTAI